MALNGSLNTRARQLVLTADERSWPADGPVLFLGEWCKLYPRKAYWQGLDACTVQHPWQDFPRFSADYAYLRTLYERVLPGLAASLNRLHGTRHGDRYWRILAGPWLATFLHIAFERWTVLSAALEGWNIGGVACHRYDPASQVPRQMNDFHDRVAADEWNAFLYSEILQAKGIKVGRTEHPEPLQHPPSGPETAPPSWKARLLNAAAHGYARLFSRPRDVFMISTYVPLERLIAVQLGLGQFPLRWRAAPGVQAAPDMERRRWAVDCAATGAFEEFFLAQVPRQMPTVINEGYRQLLDVVGARDWPVAPKAVFTSNALWGDEVVMAYTAEKVEAGASLLYGQHGGLYGVGSFSWAEEHERAVSDRYLTWGWAEQPAEKFAPIGYFKRRLASRWKENPDGYLTMVCYDYPRYTHRLDSEAMVMLSGYTENCVAFGQALRGSPAGKLLVRLTPRESGWYQSARWQANLPGALVERGGRKMSQLMLESRLMVYTYNSTGFLEAFVSGIPCIMFWDPEVSQVRDAASPCFDELRAAGVLHDTPQEAAAHVESIWGDVQGWWRSPPVQEAVRRFTDRYCSSPGTAHTNLLKLINNN